MAINHDPDFVVTSGVGLLGKSFKCKGKKDASLYIAENFSDSPHPIRVTVEHHKRRMEFICIPNESKVSIYIDSLGKRIALGEGDIEYVIDSMTHLTAILGEKTPEELFKYIENFQAIRENKEIQKKFNSSERKKEEDDKSSDGSGCLSIILIWGSLAAIWGIANIVAEKDRALADKITLYGLVIWISSIVVALISGKNPKKTKEKAAGFIYLIGAIISGLFLLGVISMFLPFSCTNSYGPAPAEIYFRR